MKYRLISSLVLSLIVGTISTASQVMAGEKVTLYKHPQCGCCEIYAQYLRDNGFDVTVVPTNELSALSEKYGIPAELEGCHLSLVNGRVIGGHVPVDIVMRFLSEKPENTVISIPGMPAGGPDMMPGAKSGPYTVYAISNGQSVVYASE